MKDGSGVEVLPCISQKNSIYFTVYDQRRMFAAHENSLDVTN